ncbi:hypothetical protein C1701_16245 [Actinoalloteichus sp. AHMU CJ021]|uniref:Uncharacterized protein n=1 Tax=Actinoalloteichus caeruleus DSM 43889 TaxID=1120930 RepID=A0ABT1JMS9_ACTCY|nr:hypothetical protein [Actinoalloteichus caeruleus]AUS79643.1 hypothetical protein C1701_16245 [Actinoalloteichus sp. AHMU CJ021]MCP2333822.1 hypothetical protein [Actinoalloteichus caeruleus DSM 43889]
MTAEFGSTAWGRAWLRRLEPVTSAGPDPDRVRARGLARRAVRDLRIRDNQVSAVLSERGRDHAITLTVPAWSPDEVRTARRRLRSSVGPPGGLHEDLPDDLAAELETAGPRIAPDLGELTATSSTGPLRRAHLLAVCYALVQRVDEEPALAVRLRTPAIQDVLAPPAPARSSMVPLAELDPHDFYDPPPPGGSRPGLDSRSGGGGPRAR